MEVYICEVCGAVFDVADVEERFGHVRREREPWGSTYATIEYVEIENESCPDCGGTIERGTI
jgi:rubredoxin